MNDTPALTFLKSVWPEDGFYCIVGLSGKAQLHFVYETIEEAATAALNMADKYDMYFTMFSLKEERVWNPAKNKGEGGWSWRTHANMHESRVFFADLDVGEGKGFSTQADALVGLKTFVTETGLPLPTVNSSGYGIHVFWSLKDALPADEWYGWAVKLHQLFDHYGFAVDPSRVEDRSSVLRIPGTLNHKRSQSVLVRTLKLSPMSENQPFLTLLSHAFIRAGLQDRPAPAKPVDAQAPGSTSKDIRQFAPISFPAVIKTCPVLRYFAGHPNDVSQPEWYAALQTVRLTEDGTRYAHLFSKGYAHYSAEETDQKLAQLEPFGPASCGHMHEVLSSEHKHLCEDCALYRPDVAMTRFALSLARVRDEAPTVEVVTVDQQGEEVAEVIPPPPQPYTRLKDGSLAITIVKSDEKDGDESFVVRFYEYDFYPVRVLISEGGEEPSVLWHAELPNNREAVEFTVPLSVPYKLDNMVAYLTRNRVMVTTENLKHMQGYMIGYMAQLMKYALDHKAYSHLGWTDTARDTEAPDGFILPGVFIGQTGERPAISTDAVKFFETKITKLGTLKAQKDLLKFYDHEEYVAHQFFVMASLAGPLFHMTGHHGLIINASGQSGASKSTSMMAGASFWGNPDTLPISGSLGGASTLGKQKFVQTLSTIPVFVDEITHMSDQAAQEFALAISQSGGRVTATKDGGLRQHNTNEKATILISTANSSLHDKLSHNNQAGTASSMRVFEINMQALNVHTGREAMEFLWKLNRNFGHIGPEFVTYVLRNYAAVSKRVRDKMWELQELAQMHASERFWFGGAAAVIVATEIATEIGLVTYKAQRIQDWFLNVQITAMRNAIAVGYQTFAEMIATFLDMIGQNMIIGENGIGRQWRIIQEPRGPLQARYEVDKHRILVAKSALKDYCAAKGINYSQMISDLRKDKVFVGSVDSRVVLGRGGVYGKANTPVWEVDLDSSLLAEFPNELKQKVIQLREAVQS